LPLRTPASAADLDRSRGFSLTASQAAALDRAGPEPKDAIAMLKADHKAVGQMFADYEETGSISHKRALVAEICTALSVHNQIEEEIFYPEVKSVVKDKFLVPQATVEHRGVKDLIAQLQGAEPGGELYDAKVRVLSDYLKLHVRDAHEEMFPQAKASSLDMIDIGARMAARKHDLLAQAA
jgi:hemerythrin superfamily protein